jgi:nucleoid-associated protein YgaU
MQSCWNDLYFASDLIANRYYEIKSGDTLWAAAKKFYGAGNRYTQIFEANREVIKDPDKIFVGQKIRISKE